MSQKSDTIEPYHWQDKAKDQRQEPNQPANHARTNPI